MGTTTVTCTATDSSGNKASISFDVTVADSTAPAVAAPADITVDAATASGTVVNYMACTATDAVDSSPTISYSSPSGNTYPVGTTTVTCTATDASNNTGNATFTITVNPYTEADTSFGTPNGYVINDAAGGSSSNEMAYGMAIDANGKIITVGNSQTATGTVWRYLPDGTLDTTFSGDGIALTSDIGVTTYEYMRDVGIDANGKIVVAGMAFDAGGTYYAALWRYNPDGTLDTTFNTVGYVYTNMGTTYQQVNVRNMTIDADGKILLVGDAYNTVNSQSDLLVWRYASNGTPDTTFCSTGYCVFTSDVTQGTATGYDIITDGNTGGKIFLTGGIAFSTNALAFYFTDLVVISLNNNGSLDTTFGSNGIASFNGPGNNIDHGNALKRDTNGNILVAGFTRNVADDDIILMRFDASGNLDTNFNTNGYVIFSNPNRDRANDLAITGTGKILLLGKKNRGGTDSNNSDFAVWRLNTDGSLDTTFGASGTFLLKVATDNPVNYSESVSQWGAILQDANGNTVIGGASNNGTNLDMTIWRLK